MDKEMFREFRKSLTDDIVELLKEKRASIAAPKGAIASVAPENEPTGGDANTDDDELRQMVEAFITCPRACQLAHPNDPAGLALCLQNCDES